MRDRLPTTRDRRLITKRPRARDYKMRARRLPENERKNSRQAPPWVFSRSIYWNRLETDPPIRDHGPKEQGESVYRDMGNVSGIRVRPRKRILYRTRIDDTDFLSFSVLIRLIAAYKYSIIRVIECCSMTLGGDVAGRETKENVRPFTRREASIPPPSSSVSPLPFPLRAHCDSPCAIFVHDDCGQLQIILKYFHIAGRKRQTDEEKHREVRGTRVRHYAAKDFVAR